MQAIGMLVTLPFRTVMAKTQRSSNVLFVALIFPVAKPTTKTRAPCATNSGDSGNDVSTFSEAVSSTFANPASPRCVPASGQFSPGIIHNLLQITPADLACRRGTLAFGRAYKPILDAVGLTYTQYIATVALSEVAVEDRERAHFSSLLSAATLTA